jgi:hypothetical protein
MKNKKKGHGHGHRQRARKNYNGGLWNKEKNERGEKMRRSKCWCCDHRHNKFPKKLLRTWLFGKRPKFVVFWASQCHDEGWTYIPAPVSVLWRHWVVKSDPADAEKNVKYGLNRWKKTLRRKNRPANHEEHILG